MNLAKVLVWTVTLLIWSWLLSQLVYNPLTTNEQSNWLACIPSFVLVSVGLGFWILCIIGDNWNNKS